MKKTKSGIHFLSSALRRSGYLGVLILAGGVLAVCVGPRLVHAVSCSSTSDCQNQINSLSSQNASTQANLNQLQLAAQGYQGAIDSLNSQIANLQGQIGSNQAEQANLNAQIAQNIQQIASNKSTLSDDIKTMYIDGQMSTIEELATSKNLSDFVDKQEYQSVVQNQLNSIIQQINALQVQLGQKKVQVSNLLKAEASQEAQLASAQAQQNQLLSMNQQQQSTYNAQVSANKSAIAQLQQQQAAIIQAGTRRVSVSSGAVPGPSGGSGGACDDGNGNGGYPMPWCNAIQDSVTTAGGFPNRECTSYAYWYFTQIEGHSDFYDNGNANQWLGNSNYPTHSAPAVGAIAVETAGTYGHVAIVQALPGQTYAGNTVPSGYVLVSEMNYDWEGHFRYSYSPLSKFAGYIY